MKMEKNTRYNNKPDEVIIYPERVEKKESGKKSFLVQLGSNLKKQETNICVYVYMFKKTFKSTAKTPCVAISVHTNTLPHMYTSGHTVQGTKYSRQFLFPFMAFQFLKYWFPECGGLRKNSLTPKDFL